jgi:hypothetical protein
MHRDEAKQLLELCRPGNEADRQDPALAEAFALLESDEELRAWFDTQQAADARISESLNALEAPADLKATILAGMRLHRSHAEASDETINEAPLPFPQASSTTTAQTTAESTTTSTASAAWWRHPWAGIAAVFAIMLGIFFAPGSEPENHEGATLAGLPPVIQFLSQEIDGLRTRGFDMQGDQPEVLKAYLASTQSPSPKSIPDCLNKMATLGCVSFEYGDTKFSMICFKNGNVYHLITADKTTYPDTLPLEPQFFQSPNKAFRVWVDGEQVKILTVHGTKEDIPEFI